MRRAYDNEINKVIEQANDKIMKLKDSLEQATSSKRDKIEGKLKKLKERVNEDKKSASL